MAQMGEAEPKKKVFYELHTQNVSLSPSGHPSAVLDDPHHAKDLLDPSREGTYLFSTWHTQILAC